MTYEEKMKVIEPVREKFEKGLDPAWEEYNKGPRLVDAFEDNYTECAYAKGFRDGFVYALTMNKGESTENNETGIR